MTEEQKATWDLPGQLGTIVHRTGASSFGEIAKVTAPILKKEELRQRAVRLASGGNMMAFYGGGASGVVAIPPGDFTAVREAVQS